VVSSARRWRPTEIRTDSMDIVLESQDTAM